MTKKSSESMLRLENKYSCREKIPAGNDDGVSCLVLAAYPIVNKNNIQNFKFSISVMFIFIFCCILSLSCGATNAQSFYYSDENGKTF